MLNTGGTDFDCVVEHALKNRFRKIVIITDGCADMTASNREKVKSGRMEMHLVLTEDGRRDIELISLAKSLIMLT